ncbi:GGDEF domain-containing protein [Ligilactobacillus apodemi]|nr:GGDEF domain-containing protein [Ligilactobacillus apodemi]MCR1901720.1 GGDEF domain-containing protein [Ligilactobacillus apodemi]
MYEFVIMVIVLPIVITSVFLGKLLFHDFLLAQNLGWAAYLMAAIVYCVQEYFVLKLSLETIGYVYFQYAIAVSVFFLGKKWFGHMLLVLSPLLLAIFFYVNDLVSLAQVDRCLIEMFLLFGCCLLLKRYLHSQIGLGVAMILMTSFTPLIECGLYGINFDTDLMTLSLLCLGTSVLMCLEFAYHNYSLHQQKKYAAIEYSSRHDKLTGLLNYAAFSEQLENFKLEKNTPVVICALDLDSFKQVNDTYGHLEGNNVLRYFGNFLTTSCSKYFGENSKIYRFGGEEFCVIIYGFSAKQCLKRFNKIEKELEKSSFTTGYKQMINLSFSGGISQVKKYTDLHSAVRRADVSLYSAKAEGRAHVCLDPLLFS